MVTLTPCVEHGRKGNKRGYASVRVAGGRYDSMHRVALSTKLGRPLSTGEVARHLCDNPRCVNQEHLVVGSQSDNIRDTEGKSGTRVRTRVLTDAEVSEVRTMAGPSSRIAAHFGVSTQAIKQIRSGARR